MRFQSGTLPTDQGFTGQRSDATSGLDYYGARYYDPVAGQFTSADTTLAGGLNRYAYVGGNPESATDPSGHLIVSQREYSQPEAMRQAQTQPAMVYVNQWAAPSTWGGFASFIGQSVLGTDTLRQSFHTLFQDPQASTGDKVKAAVAGGFTVVTDLVTIGSLAVGEPELGEGAKEADAALLAATDAEAVAATEATAATSEAAPSLLRTGNGGSARLPMSMDTVNSVAQKYGIDLSENDITINKSIAGARGSTGPDQSITLYRDAFENEEELAKTLVHEQYHVGQLQAGMPYPDPSYDYDAAASWETEAEAAAQAWWDSLER